MGLEIRKVFRAGNSLVISLPRAAMADMGLQEGSRVIVTVERGRRAIIIEPLQEDLLEIAREVIDEYRPFVAGGHAAGRPFSPTVPNGRGPAGA
ncbi:MAG TPA: AbrB/MazE/SpoVT family DNA-binding domain-containing protein [Fibrobacteria bacterium]|nr:AbrB/MazE/SpoVT family DNA-binding domain-containing protein [Fibrobacteria bacterium]